MDRREEERSKLQETADALKERIEEMKEEQEVILQDKRRKEKTHKSKLVSGTRAGRGLVLILTHCTGLSLYTEGEVHLSELIGGGSLE